MLTLAQRDGLTTNDSFLGRVRAAVRQRASYILANPKTVTQAQLDWAARIFWASNCSCEIAGKMAAQLTNDPAVIVAKNGDGSDITDQALQGAVEAICEKYG